MNQPCAHWARSWHSHYGVRKNPGIFLCLFTLQKIIQDKLKKINHDNNVIISQKINEVQIIIKT